MDVIGGSFGTSGTADFDGEYIRISAARTEKVSVADVANITTSVDKNQKFGVIGFIIGAIVLAIIFGAFIPIVGQAFTG